jgi:hypothetical protein
MFNSDECECAAACYHECVCDWVVKKQWQGLSDDEIRTIISANHNWMVFARAIEAKLKELNT